MCTVNCTIFLPKDLDFWAFCHKASLPFQGEMNLGCGITFDIFTHVFHGSFLKFY